jgi:hypothetical protein
MAFSLDTESRTGQNIAPSNSVLVLDYTATRDVRVGVCLRLMNLSSGGATFTIKVETLHSSGETMGYQTSTTAKPATSLVRYRLEHDRLTFLPNAARIKVFLSSTNTGDTSVDIDSFLFDANYITVDSADFDGKTMRQVLQLMAAVLCGETTGAGTGTEKFRSLDDSADRVTATIDAATGNRTGMTYTG